MIIIIMRIPIHARIIVTSTTVVKSVEREVLAVARAA